MIKTDEHALVCDLAETYQIYDYKQLSPLKVAVFSHGLKDDSRIKMTMRGQKVPLKTMILANISDKLSTLVWFQTEAGQKGKDRPKSLVDTLTGKDNKEKKKIW